MFKEVERFQARSESGQIYTVVERAKVIRSQPISGPAREMLGSIDSITSTGQHLNFIEDGVYEIVQTGERIRRI